MAARSWASGAEQLWTTKASVFSTVVSSEWAWCRVRGQSEDSIEAVCLLCFSL